MTAAPAPYDLLIVGATPAGCAAALRARQLNLRTLVLDAGAFPRPADGLDWLGPLGIALAQECGLTAKSVSAAPFVGLQLHSGDLKRNCRSDEAALEGWIVPRSKIEDACWRAASDAGAESAFAATIDDIVLGEKSATLRLHDGRNVIGRMLLIADGLDSRTAALARFPSAQTVGSVARRADLVWPSESGAAALDVVIGTRHQPQLVTLLRAGEMTSVSLIARGGEQPVEAQLAAFLAAAVAAKLVTPPPAGAAPVGSHATAGVALDLDTHVGKRCLLVGQAGGFASAFSGERLYPAMKSGWIAAEVVARALTATVPQDELMSFSADWRSALAEYLRLPNTDLSLLMPLVFDNAQMSARVARAFLLGQGF